MSNDLQQELDKARKLAMQADGKIEKQGPLAAHEKGLRFYTGSLISQAYGLDVGEEMAVILKDREARTSSATQFTPAVRHPFLKEFAFETTMFTAVNTSNESIRYIMIVKRVK